MASETRKIIGGGLSGLAAAINFAKNDEKVEMLIAKHFSHYTYYENG